MRAAIQMFLISLLIFCGNVFARNDISGTWEGKLEIAPGQEMTVRFVITKDNDGSYQAVLNSPDAGAIRDVRATALEYAGDKLTIEVDSLSGSFSGIVSGDTVTGEWTQPGSTLPMVLTVYGKPSTNTIRQLLGEWHGSFTLPDGRSFTNVLQFTEENGRLSGTVEAVGQKQQRAPLTDILFKGNQVSFMIAGQQNYKGVLNGGTITGTVIAGTMKVDLNLTKGKYIEPGLDMSAEDIKKLQGRWVGRVKTGTDIMINNVLTFERNELGQLMATVRSPERGNRPVKLVNLVFNDDQLSFEIDEVGKTFSGKVHNNTITGTYTYQGSDAEITLTRGAKIEPVVPRIDIPDETMEKLMGRWSGIVGNQQIAFRFERNAKGEKTVCFDVPQRQTIGALVLDSSFAEGKLFLKLPEEEYSGSLAGNKIDGVFKSGAQSYPLLLTKE